MREARTKINMNKLYIDGLDTDGADIRDGSTFSCRVHNPSGFPTLDLTEDRAQFITLAANRIDSLMDAFEVVLKELKTISEFHKNHEPTVAATIAMYALERAAELLKEQG
jgi:hypothetical protein